MTNTSDRIALVMGYGRSGTTFLAKLIDSSPDVLYRHEPDKVLPSNLPFFFGQDDIKDHLPKAKAYLHALAHYRGSQSFSLPVFPKSYRSTPADMAFRVAAFSTKMAQRWRVPLPNKIPDLVDGDRVNMLYLIKSVGALGRARLFSEAMPDMPCVHIIRHPCAVYASLRVGIDRGLMKQEVFLESLFAQKEAENYPFTLEEMERATFEEQMAFSWMLLNDKAAADMAGSRNYLRVRYEDLCKDVRHVSSQVFDQLGIDLGGQTRRFIDSISHSPVDEKRRIGYFKINRPITSAVDKWRSQIAPESVERIRQVVSHSSLGRAYFGEV